MLEGKTTERGANRELHPKLDSRSVVTVVDSDVDNVELIVEVTVVDGDVCTHPSNLPARYAFIAPLRIKAASSHSRALT